MRQGRLKLHRRASSTMEEDRCKLIVARVGVGIEGEASGVQMLATEATLLLAMLLPTKLPGPHNPKL